MSFGGRGLKDWWIQRVSAVVLAIYTVWILAYLMTHQPLALEEWQALFMQPWMRTFSLMALVSLAMHAWVGMWTIATDYLKPLCIRIPFLFAVFVALVSYVVWGISILWGIS